MVGEVERFRAEGQLLAVMPRHYVKHFLRGEVPAREARIIPPIAAAAR